MINNFHAGVIPPVSRHGAEGEGSSASPLMGLDVREHASHVASDMPDYGTETFSTDTMVNGFDDHLPIGKNPDTSFACFIAGEGK